MTMRQFTVPLDNFLLDIRCKMIYYINNVAVRYNIYKEDIRMDKYFCNPCGYTYDPEKGDPDHGIAPGTAFEDIPDDWVCPVCGVDKSMFQRVIE